MNRENLTELLRDIAHDYGFMCNDFVTCTEATPNCGCVGCEIVLEAVKVMEGGTGDET